VRPPSVPQAVSQAVPQAGSVRVWATCLADSRRTVTRANPSATSPGIDPSPTLTAVDTPDVIPITDFRQATARIIAGQVAAERPVFVAQAGYVTAIVLAPELYRGLVRRAADEATATRRVAVLRALAERDRLHDAGYDHDAGTAELLEVGGWESE